MFQLKSVLSGNLLYFFFKISVLKIFSWMDFHVVFHLSKSVFSYPDYTFISDPSATLSAGLNRRYSDESLRGVILDIHFLSLCDHLVCTFSSQVRFTFFKILILVP